MGAGSSGKHVARMGSTVLAVVVSRVARADGVEEVRRERRFADTQAARAWCESACRATEQGALVVEVQVIVEEWHHPRSWETFGPYAEAHSVQVGVCGTDGSVRWSALHPTAGQAPTPG